MVINKLRQFAGSDRPVRTGEAKRQRKTAEIFHDQPVEKTVLSGRARKSTGKSVFSRIKNGASRLANSDFFKSNKERYKYNPDLAPRTGQIVGATYCGGVIGTIFGSNSSAFDGSDRAGGLHSGRGDHQRNRYG